MSGGAAAPAIVGSRGGSWIFDGEDGVNVTSDGQKRKNGQLYLPPEGTCFSFGASTTSGAYLNGVFDNIRISDGVLDPSEFMQYEAAPFIITVR